MQQRWIHLKFHVIFLLLFLFSSCTFYPRYERPCMEMPEHWRVVSDEEEPACNIRWWEQFNDPILDALIAEALESNNDLRLATARIAQYQAQVGIVSSQLYPQIYLQGNASRTRISQTLRDNQFSSKSSSSSSYASYGGGDAGGAAAPGIGPMGAFLPDFGKLFPIFNNDYRSVFTAAYELDLWGKIRSATDASLAELLAQVDVRRAVILSVVSAVANSYINLRQYDWQLQISEQTLRSRNESYELAKVRFEEGLTSELEVAQSLAERDQAEIQLIQFQTLIPIQENLICTLIGHPPTTIIRGLKVDQWWLPPDVPTGLPIDLLEQRPDIAQAEQLMIAANFRIGEARALYFPDITLTGFIGYESGQLHHFISDPSKTWQWMANLLQPIFTGWRITSTVDLAKARKQEAVYNYLQVILVALREVDDALIAHANAKRAVIVQRERVKDLGVYLHLAKLQYENGLVDYLNVLDAERRLFDAQLDLANGEADVFSTLVDLYKALGGGWVVDAENLMKQEWAAECGKP